MAAFSRGLRPFTLRAESICSRCLFSTTSTVQSGHNRWSKIRHDKGKADANKNAQRSSFSREIALCSKSKKPQKMLESQSADFNCSVWRRSKYKSTSGITTGKREERYITGYNALKFSTNRKLTLHSRLPQSFHGSSNCPWSREISLRSRPRECDARSHHATHSGHDYRNRNRQ